MATQSNSVEDMSRSKTGTAVRRAGAKLADLVRANLQPASGDYVLREQAAQARLAASSGEKGPDIERLRLRGMLNSVPRQWPRPDSAGTARLNELQADLAAVGRLFPEVETEITICWLTCSLLEGAWRARAEKIPSTDRQECDCALCSSLPVPPPRKRGDYAWRRSDSPPLAVKTWPYRQELDSVLTGGWVWARKLNDSDLDLGLRWRYEDDILTFHEYKRVIAALDTGAATRRVRDQLATQFSVNGARSLVSGLFADYKRRVDEHWLRRHANGELTLDPFNPLAKADYGLLQLMDCLFWHVSPDSELWREEHLAALVLARVMDDMTDVRADAVTGEISNFWLSAMSAHDKTLHAACVIASIKYGCTPEAHGLMWNTWLPLTNIVWMGLTGRHALWFDGIVAPRSHDDCLLCKLRPNACTGLLADTVDLAFGPQPAVDVLSDHAAELADRCYRENPVTWPLFCKELAAFEALHGPWHGNTDTTWEILSRTYITAVTATLTRDQTRPRCIQTDSAAVGAELFHNLHQIPTGKEDTALLAYMFGCAHPHFLWNCLGHARTLVEGDWLDG
ncbi:hypothetical protein [Nocardia sp. N2S4-5]|uniref:hypothetical protein n=1 Tax=Nocardia sp. N2S4-5 TaxID=3351565 RepID=UPI0037D21EF6